MLDRKRLLDFLSADNVIYIKADVTAVMIASLFKL